MMGAARSASLRDVAPLNAGTARLFWRGAPMRHSTLALPGLSGRSHSALALPMFLGVKGALATRDWHCQAFLAGSARAPPRIGIARESWRPRALCPALHAAFYKLQRRLRQLQREPYRDASTVDP